MTHFRRFSMAGLLALGTAMVALSPGAADTQATASSDPAAEASNHASVAIGKTAGDRLLPATLLPERLTIGISTPIRFNQPLVNELPGSGLEESAWRDDERMFIYAYSPTQGSLANEAVRLTDLYAEREACTERDERPWGVLMTCLDGTVAVTTGDGTVYVVIQYYDPEFAGDVAVELSAQTDR